MKLPRQCAILVGGLGSRLGGLTSDTPKPLLDCGGRPFLAWILRELCRFGISEVILLAGYKPERVHDFAREVVRTLPKQMELKVSVEPSPAGTGGAVWQARNLLEDTFLLMNGDSWLDTNFARFLCAARESEAAGCILLHEVADYTRYGAVECTDTKVTGFREKSSRRGPGLISAGVYALDKRVLKFLSPRCSLESDVLPMLAESGKLCGAVLDGYFVDIGICDDYARAGNELPERLSRAAVFFHRDVLLRKDCGRPGNDGRSHWNPGSCKTLQAVNDSGYHAFMVFDEGGISRSYTEVAPEPLQEELTASLLRRGMTIDDICEEPNEGPGGGERPHAFTHGRCTSGTIRDVMTAWELDPHRCILVGDKEADLHSARAAGINGYVFRGGNLPDFVTPLLPESKDDAASGLLVSATVTQ